VIEILPGTSYRCSEDQTMSTAMHAANQSTPHPIPLLDPLLHALGSGGHRFGNLCAMRNILFFCTWPMEFEKGAKAGPVDDIEWLMKQPSWIRRPSRASRAAQSTWSDMTMNAMMWSRSPSLDHGTMS